MCAFRCGYKVIYLPEHPGCLSDGNVYEHRIVCENYIGRYLKQDEVVHHINHNRQDNRIENLLILCSKEAHSRLHALEKSNEVNKSDYIVELEHNIFDCIYHNVPPRCPKCGKSVTRYNRMCTKCMHMKNRKTVRPSKEQLIQEIRETSFCAVGRKYGVTDNAVRKWLKYYGVNPKEVK